MMVYISFLLVIFGLVVGSFLNVLVYRLSVEKVPKFWEGRSICPKCRHPLSWRENVPLLSFIVLGGRCRFCHRPISWQYPVVELVTAVAFVAAWWLAPGGVGLLGWLGRLGVLGIAGCFIVIFFSDLIYGLIPDEMVAAAASLGFLGYLSHLGDLGAAAATGLISGGVFLSVVLVTKFKGMGLGDVKLAALMGFLLGWPEIVVALWTAFVLGGVAALILLLLKKTKLSATIPLGPFLVVGTLIAVLWSAQILHLAGWPF